MGIGDWMILVLLACWLAAAVFLLRRKKRQGGCIGCQGTCGSCVQGNAAQESETQQDR